MPSGDRSANLAVISASERFSQSPPGNIVVLAGSGNGTEVLLF